MAGTVAVGLFPSGLFEVARQSFLALG